MNISKKGPLFVETLKICVQFLEHKSCAESKLECKLMNLQQRIDLFFFSWFSSLSDRTVGLKSKIYVTSFFSISYYSNSEIDLKVTYKNIIVKILNLYIILPCAHLYHFFPVSINYLQCMHCLLHYM